uniref:Uncharacterized protein n=1 Tax=Arundo donax TaxID=35708 RepID=A0A0A8ZBI0_ARUDO
MASVLPTIAAHPSNT